MAPTLLRVALTGGIATGKSSCLRQFERLGVPVIDADVLARQAVATGTPGLAAVVARFGSDLLRSDGTLDRAALAGIVFANPEARRDLEAIIHPYVFRSIVEWFDSVAAERSARMAVADVPLLFEVDRAADFDRVIVVACRPDQQVQRLMSRDGLSREEAERRIAVQIPIAEKRARADDVIDSSGSEVDTARQVSDVWHRLSGSAR